MTPTAQYFKPILQAAQLLGLRTFERDTERLGLILDKLSNGFPGDVMPPLEAMRALTSAYMGTIEELEILSKVWPEHNGSVRYKLTATTLTWQWSPKKSGGYATITVPFPTILPMTIEVNRHCDMDDLNNHGDECPVAMETGDDCNCEGWLEQTVTATVTEWEDASETQLADWLSVAVIQHVEPITLPAPPKGKEKKDETLCIEKKRTLTLFTDWHVDEVTSRKEAREYAKRLWQRLIQECVK